MLRNNKLPFISEQAIDQAAEALNASEIAFERAIQSLEQQQPAVLGYIFSEDFEAFTQEEREYALYLLLVCWNALGADAVQMPAVTAEALVEAEERNWDLVQDLPNSQDRLGVFFRDYPQEDLLAFLEDATSDDDDDEIVTKEGREALFIALKSILDCWIY